MINWRDPKSIGYVHHQSVTMDRRSEDGQDNEPKCGCARVLAEASGVGVVL